MYQYRADPSVLGAGQGAANSAAFTETRVNAWMQKSVLGRKQVTANEQRHEASETAQQSSVTVLTEFVERKDKIAVALYPDIFFDGPRAYLKEWVHKLLDRTLKEYNLYEEAVLLGNDDNNNNNNNNNNNDNENASIGKDSTNLSSLPLRPDPKPFDRVFQALLEQFKKEKRDVQTTPGDSSTNARTRDSHISNNNYHDKQGNKKGKEKRMWHDKEAKITKDAMAQLDFSKEDSNTKNSTGSAALSMDPSEQAIAEARATYLPNYDSNEQEQDDMDMDPDLKDENSWGTSLGSVFQQMTGNKVLTEADLEKPMEEMQKLLTTKNVAQGVAQEVCNEVKAQLVGKRLNSFFRVKTAVRQGLEASITKILNRGRTSKDSNLDIIRAAMAKRNSGNSFLLGSGSAKDRKPYVVVNVGINGVGKSTSLAKLAYYFQNHKLKPMLVAGDTFRSGAVEQLNVHAKCLDIELFQQVSLQSAVLSWCPLGALCAQRK